MAKCVAERHHNHQNDVAASILKGKQADFLFSRCLSKDALEVDFYELRETSAIATPPCEDTSHTTATIVRPIPTADQMRPARSTSTGREAEGAFISVRSVH
jgi:hypothetical protein